MELFDCTQCGAQVYFESTSCLNCGSVLGYVQSEGALIALRDCGQRLESFQGRSMTPCRNRDEGCNWLLDDRAADPFCFSCSLSETIPNLSRAAARSAWRSLEAAKRRLLFTLQDLGLPVTPKRELPGGLAFRFIESTTADPATTGHVAGTITINIAEADPAFRERQRQELGELYRTPLGHLRHESGHYYFDHLVVPEPSTLQGCRRLFGDERMDYAAALKRHYGAEPPVEWSNDYVSAYATMHPWEDWAETWAHYLHMVDTLQTAWSYGLAVRHPEPPSGSAKLLRVRSIDFDDFEQLMDGWHPVALALNGLNRSMGLSDAYPFTISQAVRDKLRFVHQVVAQSRRQERP